MKRVLIWVIFAGVVCLSGCAKKEDADAAKQPDVAAPAQGGGTHVSVHLQDGSRIPGVIVASTQTDMVLAGDDGIERKIPLAQVKSVQYGATAPTQSAAQQAAAPPAPQPPPAVVTTKTFELPVGSQVSVRTNETIDSSTAREGQTFDAQVTRNARDAAGDIVIPKGSQARIVIRSASKGGRSMGRRTWCWIWIR
jgi:hypothetical protein